MVDLLRPKMYLMEISVKDINELEKGGILCQPLISSFAKVGSNLPTSQTLQRWGKA
jgi:hypothetical protein